jgi:AsmA protein
VRRSLRAGLLAAAGVVVLGAAGISITALRFDPNSLKPRIAEAVQQATGRTLTIAGDIHLRASLWPTVEISDVSLSNPPGFSRPQMATLKGLRLSLALLPLLSREVEIGSLTFVSPNILLERTAAGEANWHFKRETNPSNNPGGAANTASPRRRVTIGAQTVSIENGTLAYRDDASAAVTTLASVSAIMSTDSLETPVHIEGTAVYNASPVSFTADLGALGRLQNPADTAPWPVHTVLEVASARIESQGTLRRPTQLGGYDLAVSGHVGDTADLAKLMPGATLPSIRDVRFAFKAAADDRDHPRITDVTVRTGSSELGSGLVVTKVDLATTAIDQPVMLDAEGTMNGLPVAVRGIVGSWLRQPIAFDLSLRVADDSFSAKGNLTAAPNGFGSGVALRDLAIDGKLLALSGDVSLAPSPLPTVTGSVNADHADLNGLLALSNKLTIQPAPPGGSAPDALPPGTARGAVPTPVDRHVQPDWIFPDKPLPFDRLRLADTDLRLTIGTLLSGDQTYRNIDAHIVLHDAKLMIDPLSGTLPEGRMEGTLTIDASQAAPPARLRLRAPGLALRPVLTALHQPAVISGNAEIYADLSGVGTSPRALASTVSGTLGIAMPGGTIDNRLLGSILGQVMSQINVLDLVGRGGASDLNCLAARMDIRQGVATLSALVLSSSLATVTGTGTVNLGAETLDLTLRPEARIGRNVIVVPVRLTGPMRKPAARVNEIKSLEANAGTIAGALLGSATPLGAIGGLLASGRVDGAGAAACPSALAAARGQAAPAARAPAAAKPLEPLSKLPHPALPDPTKTLRNLLR